MNEINNLFSSLDISASGLAAQRRRLDAIAENLANVSTTRTEDGGPYRRKITSFSSGAQQTSFQQTLDSKQSDLDLNLTRAGHILPDEAEGGSGELSGVRANIQRDQSPPIMVYDPDHPDADKNGYVKMPNINVVSEMVDMISASRAYEANVTAVRSFKEMARKALEI